MPLNELKRLQKVNRFLKLDISKDHELQEIVTFAARQCGVATALITLFDEHPQYIRYQAGTDQLTTPREDEFCNYVIKRYGVLMIPDTLLDERIVHHLLVNVNPNIRFLAGVPLITNDGDTLGSLCVIDQVPGILTDQQQELLCMLAKQVIQLLDFDTSVNILKEQFIKAKQAEIEMRSFFENSIDCHLLLGKEYDILAFNKKTEQVVKLHSDLPLVRGDQMAQHTHPELREHFYLNYLKALKGTAIFEQRALNYEAGLRYWAMKYEPALNSNGEIIGVCINSSDVTSRVKQQEIAKAQSESLREIAFIQSHELCRPVASIMGLLNIIQLDARKSDTAEFKLLETAVEELDQKIRLIVNCIPVS